MNRFLFHFLLVLIGLLSCKNQQGNNYNQFTTKENLALESKYEEMLSSISDIKSTDPEIYWFIVSWLNSNYNTPDWHGYGNEEWKEKTKKNGIDCSGFARVMQKEIFNKKIRGGSQGILDGYCNRKSTRKLEMGDLLFFRAPYSKNDRIVHVSVYLKDGYFVHATSAKSAAQGYGVMINSLDEENWKKELVTAGEIKERFVLSK